MKTQTGRTTETLGCGPTAAGARAFAFLPLTRALALTLFVGLLGFSGSAEAAARYWVAAAADNWNATANWSTVSAGAGGSSVPGSADIAYFDGGGLGNCTINATTTVAGINIAAGYTGTITQAAGSGLTVGTSHYVQAGGTFTASSSDTITFNGNFTQSGGTFNHNNGTVVFGSGGTDNTIDVNVSQTFNNLTMNKTTYLRIANGDTVVVNGTLTLTAGKLIAVASADTSTLEAKGPISIAATFGGAYAATTYVATLLIDGTGDQSFTIPAGASMPKTTLNNSLTTISTSGSGTITWGGAVTLQAGAINLGAVNHTFNTGVTVSGGTFTASSGTTTFWGNLTISGTGTLNHNNGTVIFTGSSTTTDVNVSQTFYNLTVNKTNATYLYIANGDTVVVNGTLTLTDGLVIAQNSTDTATLEAKGPIVVAATFDGGYAGSSYVATLLIDGTSNQSFTIPSGASMPATTLNNSLTTITPSGTVTWKGLLTLQAGTFAGGTATLVFDNGAGATGAGGGITVAGGTFTASSDTTCGAPFTLSSGTFTASSGTTTFKANVTVSGGTFNPNGGTINLNATGARTIDVPGTLTLNHVTLNASADANGYAMGQDDTLVINGDLRLTNGYVKGGGRVETLDLKGNLLIDATYDGSATTPAQIRFSGATDQTYTNSGGATPIGHFTINKPAGTKLILGSNMNLGTAGQNLTVNNPSTLDLSGYTLTVAGTLANNGTIIASGAGTPITAGTLTTDIATSNVSYTGNAAHGAVTVKNGTYGNLTVDNPGTTFSLAGATTVNGNLTTTVGSTLDATTNNYGLTVQGNWVNNGTFNARAGTVTLNGANQLLAGSTTFYALTKTVTSAAVLTLPAGLTNTIQNSLTLDGTAGNLLRLTSSTPGTQAKLTLSAGSSSLCYVDVQDSDASGGLQLPAYNATNSGNNLNWAFSPTACGSTGLIGYWKLDNNATDSAGTNNGAATSVTYSTSVAPTPYVNTNSGSFNGTSSVINSGAPAAFADLGAMTVAAWINPASLGQSSLGRVVDKSASVSPTSGWTIFLGGTNTISFRVQYSTTTLVHQTANNAIALNQWQHVALTWDGSITAANAKLYVNGQETAYSTTTNAAGSRVSDASSSLRIGNGPGSTTTFNGLIDDVRLYNRVMTPQEIAVLAAKGGMGVLTLSDTASTSTTLTKSTTVNAGFTLLESDATAAALSNTSGSFGAGAPGFATPAFTTTWTMPSGDGEKTVYARITRGATTYDISDSITLDTTPPGAPTGLTLTPSADGTSITASATAPASSDVQTLIWRYVTLDGNVAPSYPTDSGVGTAFAAGVTSGGPSSAQSLTASQLTPLKTYGIRVWAKDKAGNISTSYAQGFVFLSPPTPRLVITAPSSATAAVAGSALTLTITAKDSSNNTITTYAGPYSLTWTPTGGTATTLVSSSSTGWSSGVVTTSVTIGGSDAGPGTLTATDNSTSALTNGTLAFTFYPSSLSVTTSATSLTAGSPFTLTVTAKDAAGATVTRYQGSVALTTDYINPTAGFVGLSLPSIAASSFASGVAALSVGYPDAGQITITAKDTTYVSGVTLTGTSSTLTSYPAKFVVERMPLPPNLLGPYVNQPFDVRVRAVGVDGVMMTPNYPGAVTLSGGAVALSTATHTFIPATDKGSYLFTGLRATSRGNMVLTASAGAVTGTAPPMLVREGLLVIDSVTGPLGTLNVSAYIKDPATGYPVGDDESTRFTVVLGSPSAGAAASSPATTSPITVMHGTASFQITKADEGTVTVGAIVQGFPMPVQPGTVKWSSTATSTTTTLNIVQFEQAPTSGTYYTPPPSYSTTTQIGYIVPPTSNTAPIGYTAGSYAPTGPYTTTTGSSPAPLGFTMGGTRYDAGVTMGYTFVSPMGGSAGPGSYFPGPGSSFTAMSGASNTGPAFAPGSFLSNFTSSGTFAPGSYFPGPGSSFSPGSFMGGKGTADSGSFMMGPMGGGAFTSGSFGSFFGPSGGTSASGTSSSSYGPPPAAMQNQMIGVAQSLREAGKLNASQFDAAMSGIATGRPPDGAAGLFTPEAGSALQSAFQGIGEGGQAGNALIFNPAQGGWQHEDVSLGDHWSQQRLQMGDEQKTDTAGETSGESKPTQASAPPVQTESTTTSGGSVAAPK